MQLKTIPDLRASISWGDLALAATYQGRMDPINSTRRSRKYLNKDCKC